MMHDFMETHRNEPASTESFKAVVEKHMTKRMDLQQNGRMDWFFNEWVYGTEVPHYDFKYEVSDGEGGKVKVRAVITQSEVDDHFAMFVPVYADSTPTKTCWNASVVGALMALNAPSSWLTAKRAH